MSELLRIQTPDFELSISCSDVSKRKDTFDKTIAKREALTLSTQKPVSVIRFSPPLDITEATFKEESLEKKGVFTQLGLVAALELPEAIFFENIQYHFKWLFINPEASDEKDGDEIKLNVANAYLAHRSHAINESFEFSKPRYSMPAHLIGTINTANDVGWMRLPLIYIKSAQTYKNNIAFEVLPTKMSLHDDLPAMYQAIDSVFPLWRFSLVEKTEQDSAQTKQRDQFPLLWLANFSHLRYQLSHALKVISQAPHSRLQAQTSYTKAARIKGKIPARLGAKIKEDLDSGMHEQRYQVTKKQLSVDTPENRFIKMVVSTTKKRLADFEHKLRQDNKKSGSQRISNAFLEELHQWQQPLQKMLKQGFMANVGNYNDHGRESLVLQQKVGYSSAYRIWQELKFYLDVFDNQSSISMKSVAEIYEVWCFLCLKQILEQDLGFDAIKKVDPKLSKGVLGELKLKKGDRGSFDFFRKSDGIKATLYHEKKYGRTTEEIRSFLLTHKPDIILEVKLPSDQEFIWIFDAKYRISDIKTNYKNQYIGKPTEDERNLWLNKTKEEKKKSTFFIKDGVPDDAINQMHRYRDALIRIDQNHDYKSRPVCGAFALYPGHFNQINDDNPYLDAINEINIGAFALLPSIVQESSKSNNGYQWLLDFLRQNIGNNTPINESSKGIYQHNSSMGESIYLQEAARIPYDGMRQVLYKDLTLVLAINENDIKISTSTEYSLNKNSFPSRYSYHILKEIHYLGLALCPNTESSNCQIQYVWPVKNMIALTDHFVFELDKALKLQDIIHNVPSSIEHSFKLTTLGCLQDVNNFNDIKEVYQDYYTETGVLD